MMIFLRLVPLFLLTLSQIIAAFGIAGEASSRGIGVEAYRLPQFLYALAALGGLAGIVQAVVMRNPGNGRTPVWASTPAVVAVSLVTVVAAMAGPLLWGHVAGDFHLAHHLVRAALLAVVFVFYWWYVAANR